MQKIEQTLSQQQVLFDPLLARIPAALSEAQHELASLAFEPGSRAGLAAAQLWLIFTRIERGIPPGRESLANLVRVAAGVRGEATEVGA